MNKWVYDDRVSRLINANGEILAEIHLMTDGTWTYEVAGDWPKRRKFISREAAVAQADIDFGRYDQA